MSTYKLHSASRGPAAIGYLSSCEIAEHRILHLLTLQPHFSHTYLKQDINLSTLTFFSLAYSLQCGSVFGPPLQVTVRPVLWDRCHICPVCVTLVYCGQTVAWIKMPLGTEVGSDIVLDGDPAPHGSGHRSLPHFPAHVYCGKTVAHLSNCLALEL